ncbi:MAG: hypothetical protein ACRDRZ_18375 [Pseudonocardiaceae bacterium]
MIGVDRSSRRAVLQRLTMLDDMVRQVGFSVPVRTARSQIRRLTGSWRELLIRHEPDARGRCPVCSGWLRRRTWPCQVWVTAIQLLIGEGHEEQTPMAPLRSSFRRPREVEVVARSTDAHAEPAMPAGPAADVPRQRSEPEADTVAVHRAAVTGPGGVGGRA